MFSKFCRISSSNSPSVSTSSGRNEYRLPVEACPSVVNRSLPAVPSSSLSSLSHNQQQLSLSPLQPQIVNNWAAHRNHHQIISSDDSLTGSDSDSDVKLRNNSVQNAFIPDLVQNCSQKNHSSSSLSSNPHEDYEEINEVISQLNVTSTTSTTTVIEIRNSNNAVDGSVIIRDDTIKLTPSTGVMGQNLSLRRPRISLTWVLREQQSFQSSPNLASGETTSATTNITSSSSSTETTTTTSATGTAVTSVPGGVTNQKSLNFPNRKKPRGRHKEYNERLFSEKYVTNDLNDFDQDYHYYYGDEFVPNANTFNDNCKQKKNIKCESKNCESDNLDKKYDRLRKVENGKKVLNNFSEYCCEKSTATVNENNNNGEYDDESTKGYYCDYSHPLTGGGIIPGTKITNCLKITHSEPYLSTASEGPSRRHRHRRRRERNRSQRFGYDIKNVDEFLSKCSLSSPGNIPVVLSSSSTLYQTRPGGYQIEILLPLGMVVNAVFKNQNWLYVQTPHAEEGYVGYSSCLPLGILPSIRPNTISKPQPCWESNGDVFPKPCGNMTDSEKELQLRGGTRSEGTQTPRTRRAKSCGEKHVDTLYLRAASQPKLIDKSYAQLKLTNKYKPISKLNDEYVFLQPSSTVKKSIGIVAPKAQLGKDNLKQQISRNSNVKLNNPSTTTLLRQTLLAVRENFVSDSISVQKGDVITLLACKKYKEKGLSSFKQWFFVRTRDGSEGYIPAEVAGHGFL